MDIKKFNQLLFKENSRVYAALDGASVPDLPMILYKMNPEHICLYRGDLEPDIAEVAPYLIRMVSGTDFTNWVLTEGWGKHWGIFAQTRYSLTEMRKHFRSFLTVHDETGNPMLFRYYDPRVLRTFLPTCNGAELTAFFGNVTNYILEDEDSQNLLNYSLQNGELKKMKQELVEQ
jgi:hypothetical protein